MFITGHYQLQRALFLVWFGWKIWLKVLVAQFRWSHFQDVVKCSNLETDGEHVDEFLTLLSHCVLYFLFLDLILFTCVTVIAFEVLVKTWLIWVLTKLLCVLSLDWIVVYVAVCLFLDRKLLNWVESFSC